MVFTSMAALVGVDVLSTFGGGMPIPCDALRAGMSSHGEGTAEALLGNRRDRMPAQGPCSHRREHQSRQHDRSAAWNRAE